jgi:hypothetical protein
MRIGKYEFDSQEKADSKIKNLGSDHPHSVFRIGNIALEAAEYDEEGELIKEAVYSTKYSVDVLFVGLDDHPYGWKSYAVDVQGDGVHSFMGLKYQDYKF